MWLRPSRNSVEQRVQALALGNERGGPQEASAESNGTLVRDEVLQHVLREHDADDLVAIVADHGEARVVRLDDDLEQLLGRLVLRDDDHVAARHHDVAHLRVRDLEHALQHRELVGVEDAALAELCEELGYILAGLDLTGAALNEPLPPSGYAGVAARVSIVRHWNYFIES